MSPADIEDRLASALRASADAVSAPPDQRARLAVAGRADDLRARRRTRRNRIVGLAACAAVVGGLAWWGRDDQGAMVVTDSDTPVSWDLGPAPAEAPAFTVEGLVPIDGEASVYDPPPGNPPLDLVSPVTGEGVDERPGIQAFRRPRDYGSPTVHVTYGPTVVAGTTPATSVPLADGTDGRLVVTSPTSATLSWRPTGGTDVAVARAHGLSPDELRAFVDGLLLRQDGLGFDATVLPDGLAEDPIEPAADPSLLWSADRALRLVGEAGAPLPGPVQVDVTRSDEADFESMVADRISVAGSVDQVTALGRPAVLVHRRDDEDRWTVLWRHNRSDWVELDITAPDRPAVDRLLASLHEVDAATFTSLLGQADDNLGSTSPGSTAVTLADPSPP